MSLYNSNINHQFIIMKTNTTLRIKTMKFVIALFIASLFIGTQAKAQINTYYSFTQSTGTYTPISGGTVLGDTINDDEVFNNNTAGQTSPQTNTGFPIGFSFTYNGNVYDKFAVNTNGWIVVGTGSVTIGNSSGNYTPISATGIVGYESAIAALGRDIEGQSGSELSYKTIGTAPNRSLVVQWSKYRKYSATGDTLNFQIKLNETSNIIEVVYGLMKLNSSPTTVQVGLRGAVNTDFNNRTTTSNWAATTAGATNSDACNLSSTVFPANGTMFVWVPPVSCSGTPTAGITISTDSSVCSAAPFTLSLSGATVASGLTYQWQSSTNNSTWNNIPSATSSQYTNTQTSATYYRCTVSCGSSSANSISIQVKTISPVVYSFTQSTGIYTPISGGTVLGDTTNDDEVFNNNITGQISPQTNTGFPIGFNFTYNGNVYDKFAVNTNGWIVVGTGSITVGGSSGNYSPISSTGPDGFINSVAALGRDLEGQPGSELSYKTIGTAPNRSLIVQWSKYKKYYTTGSGDTLNFQIRLNETTNTINTIYGSMKVNANSTTVQVGLRSFCDFNNRATTSNWASTTAGTTNADACTLSNTVFPANGTIFIWTPPSAGIEEYAGQNNLLVYPNPSNGIFTIETETIKGSGDIYIYNIMGDVLYKSTIKNQKTDVDFSNQSKGIYFYKFISEDKSISTGKIIIQ